MKFLFEDFEYAAIILLLNFYDLTILLQFIHNLIVNLVKLKKVFVQSVLLIVKKILICLNFSDFEFRQIKIITKIIFLIFYQMQTSQLYQFYLQKDDIKFIFSMVQNMIK